MDDGCEWEMAIAAFICKLIWSAFLFNLHSFHYPIDAPRRCTLKMYVVLMYVRSRTFVRAHIFFCKSECHAWVCLEKLYEVCILFIHHLWSFLCPNTPHITLHIMRCKGLYVTSFMRTHTNTNTAARCARWMGRSRKCTCESFDHPLEYAVAWNRWLYGYCFAENKMYNFRPHETVGYYSAWKVMPMALTLFVLNGIEKLPSSPHTR